MKFKEEKVKKNTVVNCKLKNKYVQITAELHAAWLGRLCQENFGSFAQEIHWFHRAEPVLYPLCSKILAIRL